MHSAEFRNCIKAALNSNSFLQKRIKQRERVRRGKKKKKGEVRDKTQHFKLRRTTSKEIYTNTQDPY